MANPFLTGTFSALLFPNVEKERYKVVCFISENDLSTCRSLRLEFLDHR